MDVKLFQDGFKINQYLTLKYEHESTYIYVKGEFFNLCKFLLLTIPLENMHFFNEIESIDEIAEQLDSSLESFQSHYYNISPKTEFWAHCSNIQVWYENKYDTKLLHSNIAFPLLKRLTEAGDPLAKRVFKEEIAKRLASGSSSVISYLFEEGYNRYLSNDEINHSILNFKEAQVLDEIQKITATEFEFISNILNIFSLNSNEKSHFSSKDKNIIGLECKWLNEPPYYLPESILTLRDLSYLIIDFGYKKKATHSSFYIPNIITKLKTLRFLGIYTSNLIKIPDDIGDLNNLKELAIYNELSDIKLPDSINKLETLEYLELGGKSIVIPNSIRECTNLHSLYLKGDFIFIPNSINYLSSLTELSIKGKVEAFPTNITDLKKLRLVIIPDSLITNSVNSWLKALGLVFTRIIDNSYVFRKPECSFCEYYTYDLVGRCTKHNSSVKSYDSCSDFQSKKKI